MEIGFYHLTRSALEEALFQLLDKILASRRRAVVVASSSERVEDLARALWTLGKESFLPHGTRADGFVEDQPVLLTDTAENPNRATVLVLVDGAEIEPPPEIERVVVLFDGGDPAALARARSLWQRWRSRGAALTYWQQGAHRGWERAQTVGAAST